MQDQTCSSGVPDPCRRKWVESFSDVVRGVVLQSFCCLLLVLLLQKSQAKRLYWTFMAEHKTYFSSLSFQSASAFLSLPAFLGLSRSYLLLLSGKYVSPLVSGIVFWLPSLTAFCCKCEWYLPEHQFTFTVKDWAQYLNLFSSWRHAL